METRSQHTRVPTRILDANVDLVANLEEPLGNVKVAVLDGTHHGSKTKITFLGIYITRRANFVQLLGNVEVAAFSGFVYRRIAMPILGANVFCGTRLKEPLRHIECAHLAYV